MSLSWSTYYYSCSSWVSFDCLYLFTRIFCGAPWWKDVGIRSILSYLLATTGSSFSLFIPLRIAELIYFLISSSVYSPLTMFYLLTATINSLISYSSIFAFLSRHLLGTLLFLTGNFEAKMEVGPVSVAVILLYYVINDSSSYCKSFRVLSSNSDGIPYVSSIWGF